MNPRSDPWLGATLAGRYLVVARMGAGGMGVVYRAWDQAHDRYVVVKTPRRELLGDAKFVVRFEQELTALRALAFPSIVPIVDLGEFEGVPYAVMPYLAGGSLKQRRTPLPDKTHASETPSSLWRWLPAISQAIDFVHSSGYIHRDVKPDNILFDGRGRPYLGDFGVAKAMFHAEDAGATRGLTGTGFALGTPDYMAPELISGVKPAPPVDQYALAVMTYELLAGRKPFDGPTPAAIMIAHATGQAPPLPTLCPGVAKSVVAAVERGMQREPTRRFDTCAAFAAAALADIAAPPELEKMQLICPSCSRLLNVKPDWAGKQGNCPRCKTPLTIAGDLASLWIPSERGDGAAPTEAEDSARFGSTPAKPVTISRAGVGHNSPQPSAFEAMWSTFSSSGMLQAAAAGVAALGLMAVVFVSPGWNESAPQPSPGREQVAEGITTAVDGPQGTEVLEDERLSAGERDSTREESTPTVVTADEPPAPTEPEPGFSQIVDDEARPAATGTTTALDAVSLPPPPPELPTAILQPAPPPERRPVPDESQIVEATELIKQAFTEEYAAARESKESRIALIDQLDKSQADTSDRARRYALLLEAQRLAVEADGLVRSLAFASTRGELYSVDVIPEKLSIVDRFSKLAPEKAALLHEDFIEATLSHLADDEYEVAEQLADTAVQTAKTINREQKQAAKKKKPGRGMAARPAAAADVPFADVNGEALIDQAEELVKRVAEQRQKHDAFEAAMKTLPGMPDDPDANAAAGRFLCFMKAAWNEGLPYLAKGRDETLADLAGRQLRLQGLVPGEILAIAGEWWDADKKTELSATETTAARSFAGILYRDALPGLTDPVDINLATTRASGAAAGPGRESGGESVVGIKKEAARSKRLADNAVTPQTEAAVDAALTWLIEHQMPDGGWAIDFTQCPTCAGACDNPGNDSHREDRAAATAMALLPFLGRGLSHRDGPYRKELNQGIKYLAAISVAGNGQCYGKQGSMYSQGLAALALAEAYGLTKDAQLKVPAQAAVTFIMNAQDPKGGGWRYKPRQPGDTSATGWQIAALRSADAAGLTVHPVVLARANEFLNSVQENQGQAYGYTSPGNAASTSAIGLLCRTYLGTQGQVPQFNRGVDRVAKQGPGNDLYLNYYATALLYVVGGDPWNTWNRAMQQQLLDSQERDGHEKGSWFAPYSRGHGPDAGGRLFTTFLATLILEVPYR
jgi:serine/threonine protein kinase